MSLWRSIVAPVSKRTCIGRVAVIVVVAETEAVLREAVVIIVVDSGENPAQCGIRCCILLVRTTAALPTCSTS
tara:strand:- start:107 stop:325 length:219 start_codon:yes stop_codon:yes gene_type:complete